MLTFLETISGRKTYTLLILRWLSFDKFLVILVITTDLMAIYCRQSKHASLIQSASSAEIGNSKSARFSFPFPSLSHMSRGLIPKIVCCVQQKGCYNITTGLSLLKLNPFFVLCLFQEPTQLSHNSPIDWFSGTLSFISWMSSLSRALDITYSGLKGNENSRFLTYAKYLQSSNVDLYSRKGRDELPGSHNFGHITIVRTSSMMST